MISGTECNDLKILEEIGKKSLPIYYDFYNLLMMKNSFIQETKIYNYTYKKKIVGFIVIQVDDIKKNTHIMSIAVDPEYRNKGIGKKLINYIERDDYYITLNVQCSNKNAIKFYKKIGFEIKETKNNYYKNLIDNDAYYMLLSNNHI